MRVRGERGVTLIELFVVMALASLVTLGLIAFYFNSQSMWVDGSTQAIAQRDGTLLLQAMAPVVHAADHVDVLNAGDSLHQGFVAFQNGNEIGRFQWQPDNLVHQGIGDQDKGPVVPTHVLRFSVSVEADTLLAIPTLILQSAQGRQIPMTVSYAMHGGTH